MTSCQVSSLANLMFTTAMTAGVFGLLLIAVVMITRLLTERGRGLETEPTGVRFFV